MGYNKVGRIRDMERTKGKDIITITGKFGSGMSLWAVYMAWLEKELEGKEVVFIMPELPICSTPLDNPHKRYKGGDK